MPRAPVYLRGIMGHVYLAEALEIGRIKVGWSKNPNKRVANISSESPVKVRLIAFKDGTIKDEGRVHLRLKEWRLKGEWFLLCDGSLGVLRDEFGDINLKSEQPRPPPKEVPNSIKQFGIA